MLGAIESRIEELIQGLDEVYQQDPAVMPTGLRFSLLWSVLGRWRTKTW